MKLRVSLYQFYSPLVLALHIITFVIFQFLNTQ